MRDLSRWVEGWWPSTSQAEKSGNDVAQIENPLARKPASASKPKEGMGIGDTRNL